MNLKNLLQSKVKSFLAVILGAAVLSQLVLPALPALADGPRFNFLDGDHELFMGANQTRGDKSWADPVSGVAGDTFAGLIYYHNGMLNTTAHNTIIKVSMPSQTTNNQAVLSASISADNATTVTDTVINGVVNDPSGLTINLDQDATLQLVPGSVKWIPNAKQTSDAVSPLPNGQTGDTITTSGINIGDIQGCWNFSGFVIFSFKTVKKTTPANIIKSKTAENVTSGVKGTNISANPGDTIKYTLTTQNTGGSSTSLSVSDDISDILRLADIASISDSGAVNGNVISWPAETFNMSDKIDHTFTVKIKNPLPSGSNTMTNVYGNSVVVTVSVPTPSQPVLHISKNVRNFTISEANFSKENTAFTGDTLEYKIDFSNTGTVPADNVTLSDTLPANVSYLAGTTVISMNGEPERTFMDGISGNGINIGSIAAGASGFIKFKALTASNLADNTVLTNTAFLKFGSQILQDSATTKIKPKTPVVTPTVTPTPTTQLPKTGDETGMVALLSSLSGVLGFSYFKYRKVLLALIQK